MNETRDLFLQTNWDEKIQPNDQESVENEKELKLLIQLIQNCVQ